MYIIRGWNFFIMKHIGSLSLKTHVHWLIWFSSFYQLWFSELEKPMCADAYGSQLSSTLDFQAWKPCALAQMVFKLSSTLDFWLWKPYASAHMVFKMFSILDFWAWKHVCQCIWCSSSLQFLIFEVENPCALAHGFKATLNSNLSNLISRFIWSCHCF